MELTIDKQQFLRGLARTHGVADRKSSMHILSNVLLTAEGTDRLRLSATDLYLGVTAVVPAKIKKGGTIAVAARTLFDIVKNLPEGCFPTFIVCRLLSPAQSNYSLWLLSVFPMLSYDTIRQWKTGNICS